MPKAIDLRLRPPTPEWTREAFAGAMYYPRNVAGFRGARSAWEESPEELLAEMDRAGVEVGVAMGRYTNGFGSVPNEDLVKVTEEYPGRFVVFAGVDLDHGFDAAALADALDHPGVRGLSIEPGSVDRPRRSDDDSLTPVYELAAERGVPVSISLSALLCGMAGHDLSWSNPESVAHVARRYPDLPLIVSHAGWPFSREMVSVALFCPNVYVSPDLYMSTQTFPSSQEFVDAANLYLADRTLFGSAYPTRSVEDAVDDFLALDLRPGVAEKVLYDNAARVLGL